MKNSMKLTFAAVPENESLARMAISAFVLPVNPTLEQLADVKTAVSEAVTNCIIHGYPLGGGEVSLTAQLDEDGLLTLEVRDSGVGIADVERAMQPFYSTDRAHERAGMGFMVMQSFMDSVEVRSALRIGTSVRMEKQLSQSQEQPAKMA
ncbi:MAG: anti-sigma F factor [Clostridia bacterium]|nr:anti-sigma F factor [Clostridia bacterium]